MLLVLNDDVYSLIGELIVLSYFVF